jgi:enoyl-[acyl-carrier protein] reductase I
MVVMLRHRKEQPMNLAGKKGLVVGIANDQSIAWGCAQAFVAQGAQLAVTYLNDKAKPHVQPLAEALGAPIIARLDVTQPAEMDALFAAITQQWGRLDFLLHSIAFAPKADLQGRLVDSSAEGFTVAMDVSCHSLMRLAKAAEPLMTQGGSILTLSYYGAEKVIPHYNLMGPVKAALEASVRYMAHELGPQAIRVNALSTGPVNTRAASGLSHFDALMQEAAAKAPLHQLVTLEQIGEMAAFLVSDNARQVTGQTLYVDAGYNSRG